MSDCRSKNEEINDQVSGYKSQFDTYDDKMIQFADVISGLVEIENISIAAE